MGISASSRGSALIQVIIIGVVMGAFVGIASRIAGRAKATSMRVRDMQSLSLLKSSGVGANVDPGLWVQAMRNADTSGNLSNCLNIAATPNCSGLSTTATDAWVTSRATQTGWTNRRVYSVNLWDMNGTQIAGTETSNFYYTPGGLSSLAGVTSVVNRRYQATGYMITERNSGDPGKIIFVRKLSLTSAASQNLAGNAPVRPVYEETVVDDDWRNPGGRGLPVGSIVSYLGVAPPGSICPATKQAYVFANGCTLSAAVFPQLCAVLGTTWGATCQLPNLVGAFLRGSSGGSASAPAVIAQQGGLAGVTSVGKLSTSSLPAHSHTLQGVMGGSMVATASVPPFNISATFAGGWGGGFAGGGGNSQDCPAGWPSPCGGTVVVPTSGTPTYSISASGVSTVNFSIPSGTPFTATPPAADVSGGVETRPANIQLNYVIRADY